MAALDPLRALAAGAQVVTPNNRLARMLAARHDAAMQRRGERAWAAARVMPWHAWLASLWREAVERDLVASRLLSSLESRFLWQRLVADDAQLPPTLSAAARGGVADLAGQAWALVHGWGSGGPSWRAWRDTALAPPGSDPEAFARWAERYQRELAGRDVQDTALLADALVRVAALLPREGDVPVVLAGFLEFTPQQQRLLGALRDAGMRIAIAPEPTARGHVERVIAPTLRDEVVLALQWARERALQAPGERIGIAIEGLAARRDEVRALADDILCPALQWPGQAGAPRPYDLSLAPPLADHPVVAAALGWLGLAHGRLDRAQAAALFRSPHGPGHWTVRAGCEREWIEASRAWITAADAVAALDAVDRPAAGRLREALAAVPLTRTLRPRAWAQQWRSFLSRCGWPGEGTAPPAQYQAQEALARALEDFARLEALDMPMAPAVALALLRDHLRTTLFQPEGTGAPVAILGLLEAASIDFDALWVSGLSGQEWPPAPAPNPLLPLAWQRERDVPRASAARELAFAAKVTERLLRCAPEVVLSAPAVLADATARPTALLDGTWPSMTRPDALDTVARLAAGATLEAIDDARAPPLPAGPAPGGTGAIAAQSDCPFMATARYRLRAHPWPVSAEGLSPLERGQLAHALMAAFWREVRTHDAFVALDAPALAQRIAAAAQEARDALPEGRWQVLPPVVAAAEGERLPGIAATWLETIERPRDGFVVERIEARGSVELGGLVFRVTLDRVDRLSDGSAAIIDYKTGLVDSTRSWFAQRPRSPQLGVYFVALRQETPPVDVHALAYGRLKADEIAAIGFVAQAAQWPALTDAGKQRDVDGWAGIEDFFQTRLPALATELREGVASVTPRTEGGRPCRICARQSLCRIQAVDARAAADHEERDDDR